MWKNYLITTLRNISRQKLYSFINILGLAAGLAAAIMIFLWIQHETSYDSHHSRSERIYKLIQTQHYSTGPLTTHCMPGPIRKDMVEEVPEIVDGFAMNTTYGILRNEDKIFSDYIHCAEPGIFRLFDFEVIEGNPEEALQDVNSAVITDKMAEKYFGDEDPMNQTLTVNNEHHFTIRALVRELPESSSVRPEIILPFQFLERVGYNLDRYGWNSHSVYVELHPDASMENVNEKIKGFIWSKNGNPEHESTVDVFLFPMVKEHLYNYTGSGGNIRFVYIFLAVAVFILVIASINFMNLATARSTRRSLEIGLRKTVGGTRRQLILQFLGESALITLVSAVLGILIVYLLLPSFGSLTGKELTIDWTNPVFVAGLVGIVLFVSLLAGSYPALYLSSFQPVSVLKGARHAGKSGARFRRVLVVFQFTLSVVLIVSTIVVYRQLDFVKNKDIGIDLDNMIYIPMRGKMTQKYDLVRNKLFESPLVTDITRGTSLPFHVGSNSGSFNWEGKDPNDEVLIGFERVGYDYTSTLGMQMEAGRFYDKSYGTDTAAIVINRTAARLMGMDDPVGKWIEYGSNSRFTIIGVMEDYHFLPLQHEMAPLVLLLNDRDPGILFARLSENSREEALAHVESSWKEIFPDAPFRSSYLSDRYENIYYDEKRLGEIFKYFSILAILITCLGLTGLASFMTSQKTKEIGIRKTFGASGQSIFLLLSGNFTKWVVLSNLIAWPLAWWIMHRWLQDYAYHTTLSWWIFALAGAISMILMLITISYQVIRSAHTNPAEALRYE